MAAESGGVSAAASGESAPSGESFAGTDAFAAASYGGESYSPGDSSPVLAPVGYYPGSAWEAPGYQDYTGMEPGALPAEPKLADTLIGYDGGQMEASPNADPTMTSEAWAWWGLEGLVHIYTGAVMNEEAPPAPWFDLVRTDANEESKSPIIRTALFAPMLGKSALHEDYRDAPDFGGFGAWNSPGFVEKLMQGLYEGAKRKQAKQDAWFNSIVLGEKS
jgi:hypothetical protein